jgi:hypothetical protein
MSDNYQAIYDAVRSRIHNCDVGDVIERGIREAFGNVSHQVVCVAHEYESAAQEQQRPCVVFQPKLSMDGNQWCALYGDNLQEGVAGFGDAPAKAMSDFDKQWYSARAGVQS